MTDKDIKKMIEEKVLEVMILANEIFEVDFPLPELEYRLTGRTAGNCRIPPAHNNKKRLGWINFNLEICRHNLKEFLNRTVRHEIAHLIDCYLNGRTKPHGRNWKLVMWKLGDKNPTRCHSYNMSKVTTKRGRRYLYECDCEDLLIPISGIRHKRALAGRKYYCKKCKKNITFTGKIESDY